jgi:hypothetical protein
MVPGDGHKVQKNIRFHVQEIGSQHCDEPLNSVDISTPNSPSAKQMLKWVLLRHTGVCEVRRITSKE